MGEKSRKVRARRRVQRISSDPESALSLVVGRSTAAEHTWNATIASWKDRLKTLDGCKAFLENIRGSRDYIFADLRKRYFFNAEDETFQDDDRLLRPEELADWAQKVGVARLYRKALFVCKWVAGVWTDLGLGDPTQAAAILAYRILEDPDAIGRWRARLLAYPHEQVQRRAAFLLSGQLLARTNFRINKRLSRAKKAFPNLNSQIPGSIIEARAKWKKGGPVVEGKGSLFRLSIRSIEELVPAIPRKRGGGKVHEVREVPLSSSFEPAARAEDALQMQEEAREALDRLARPAALSKREREVFELCCRGLSETEMARHLRSTVGNVRKLKYRALKKVCAIAPKVCSEAG